MFTKQLPVPCDLWFNILGPGSKQIFSQLKLIAFPLPALVVVLITNRWELTVFALMLLQCSFSILAVLQNLYNHFFISNYFCFNIKFYFLIGTQVRIINIFRELSKVNMEHSVCQVQGSTYYHNHNLWCQLIYLLISWYHKKKKEKYYWK